NGFALSGLHPVVYVGRAAHGSYHDAGGLGGCGYFDDSHHPTPDRSLETWRILVSLDDNEEPWMRQERAAGFNWGEERGKTPPTKAESSCDMDVCKGVARWAPAELNGCYKQECRVGDRDSGVACLAHCRAGYTDGGLLCTNWKTLHTYAKERYGYS